MLVLDEIFIIGDAVPAALGLLSSLFSWAINHWKTLAT
jgi:hypothetical protein